MNQPTPEEAAAALRAFHEGRQRVIRSAAGSRWLWVTCGLAVFGYSAANDLFPATRGWLTWTMLAGCLLLIFGMRTRVGGALLGQQVSVSGRTLPLTVTTRLLRLVPVLGLGIIAGLIVLLLHLPHGQIYYGALAGLYIIFLGPRFQLWLLRRQDED